MSFDETLKSILATLIIAFSFGLAGSALADQGRLSGTVWLWSEASPKSSAAARAFGDGHIVRGLRLARQALELAEDKRDRLIAHHNLCIAHAARSMPQRATRHCQETRRLADDGFIVVESQDRITAEHVLDANLARLGLNQLGQLP